MTLYSGQKIGPYEIIAPIGQGGMAHVYKAVHPKLNRIVALKMVLPIHAQDKGFMERFEREARIIANLDHPHIVPLYDYDEHEGQPYLAMKYIEGSSMKEVMALGKLPTAEITTVLRPIASAIDYAHKQGILHRDVKPSNMMVDKIGTPYLADFGLARASQAGASTISADMILGTPHYMAPEQARGQRDLSGAVDIYALGVVLYEMLVGDVPFNADTPYAIIHQHITAPLPTISASGYDISPQVEAVLLRVLSKDPEDRYPTATAFLDAYEHATQQRKPIKKLGATPTPPIQQPSPTIIVRDAPTSLIKPEAELSRSLSLAEKSRQIADSKQQRNSATVAKVATPAINPSPSLPIQSAQPAKPTKPANFVSEKELLREVEGRLQRRNAFLIHAVLFVPLNVFVWWLYISIRLRYYEFWFRFNYSLAITILWTAGLAVHAAYTYTHSEQRARQRDTTIRALLSKHYADLSQVPSGIWTSTDQWIQQRDKARYGFFKHVVAYLAVSVIAWMQYTFWRQSIWNLFPYPLAIIVIWGAIILAHLFWLVQPVTNNRSLTNALEKERERLRQREN